ncbi:M48 family metalloprotease [Fimbriiglobus ruber]|uniref:Zn-dependent protease with chaperone function n=1 Tax=Fimbriiglobus ruber TaxID=1908690 RepID=A0A225DJF3_9BACT|nr:M48 family metalloprotease [Fimbriiglobus ruber]OWK41590.1 Zn-dependent protease with chaperone function [Fimbriiglobus ruber]
MRDSVLEQIRADQSLSEEERARAVAFFTNVPFSQLILDKEIASKLPDNTQFHYATFRWMILLSAASVLVGVAVFLLAGMCVVLSLYSQDVQYLSLLVGWHVLRICGAFQTAAQGILVVALSFWVTALWFNFFSVKLILVSGLLALVAVAVVIAAIFKRVKDDFVVAGQVLTKDDAAPIWDELRRICDKVGTQLPDQIIAGIDDNFFVTEREVIVGGKTYCGRTLFVSLSLLKQLQGSEAEAILAHEMAHFSGQDTLYSGKISPMLSRYDHYLLALRDGGLTAPIYYFMLFFRALYRLSLGRQSRRREHRADRIAVETTSAMDFAGGLLRTVAYSRYRNGVEQNLFKHERVLDAANVCERIEQGFHGYAACFVSGADIGQLASAHPFDSHPPLSQRLQAVGKPLESADTQTLLTTTGDGRWYQYIPSAEQMEREQWRQYEERFRLIHEHSLPFRFLPETPEECEIVVKTFPPLTAAGNQGVLDLDYEKMNYTTWPEPIRYAEITNLSLDQNRVLKIAYQRDGKQSQSIKMSTFSNQQEVINVINHYYGRYRAAADYQNRKRQEADSNK